MKLVLPKEHGAWAMWIAPFFIGSIIVHVSWLHLLLFVSIFFAYIAISPFFQGLRRPTERKKMWKISSFYLLTAMVFGLPLIYNYPVFLYILLAVTPFLGINLYYVKQKKERALVNDVAAIIALTSTFFAAYYLGAKKLTLEPFMIWLWILLFFFGSVLYVKSLLRERDNPWFKKLAGAYMILLPFLVFFISGLFLMTAYLFSTMRFFSTLSNKRMTPKIIGIIEIVNTIWFTMVIVCIYQ